MSYFRRWWSERFGAAEESKEPSHQADEAEAQPSVPGIRIEVSGDSAMATVDLDEFGPEAQPLIMEEMVQQSGLPIFKGTVEHGYAMRAVDSHLRCPRCEAETRQQIAHFIYATDIAPRVMLAPAGYFCTACPTVIVDENLIAVGLKEGYNFRAVVGVDYAGEREPDLFRTWNGHEPMYILDEEGQVMDLVTGDQRHSKGRAHRRLAGRHSTVSKRRRKMAQQSRQRNRR
ncbi:MAG: hypothetical protein GEU99_03435 [Luteitalea sp.]|nr:hypothetical protein [Luteitalea sp.]